jgi:colicin import membrane protein
MTSSSERLEFAPPPTPGLVRAMLLALLAHGALVAVLAVGVQWKHQAAPVTVEAELWSEVPVQAAAPAPLEPPPEPPKPPEPVPETKPQPKPEPVVVPKPAPQPDPAIALAREKEKAKLAKDKRLDEERQAKEKLAKEKLTLDKKKQELLAQEKALKDKTAKREAVETKKLEELRQQNIKRMAGLAGSGGSGDAGSTGTVAQASGPSAGYAGRIRGRIKPNITYTESFTGNPTADVEVRTAPDGTIVSRRITKSSGVKSWDDAVLHAIDKTEVLPKDTDGRVPSMLIISFRPND